MTEAPSTAGVEPHPAPAVASGRAETTAAPASTAPARSSPPGSTAPPGTAPPASTAPLGSHSPSPGASSSGDAPRSDGPHPPVRAPRLATPADVPEIVRLIRELAEYERALHEVRATPEAITHLLFSAGSGPLPGPVAACHVIDADPAPHPTGAPPLAGMALWFRNASTWLAVPGIYLEDLYVSAEYRGRGYGRALLATLAALCVEHGYGRLDWSVLDWNSPAIGFYESLGAQALSEWTGHRLTGESLRRLATEAGSPTSPSPR